MCKAHEHSDKQGKWFAKPGRAYLALIPDAESKRSKLTLKFDFGSTLSGARHPRGEDALRQYANACTLIYSARITEEQPLVPVIRRSSRKTATQPTQA